MSSWTLKLALASFGIVALAGTVMVTSDVRTIHNQCEKEYYEVKEGASIDILGNCLKAQQRLGAGFSDEPKRKNSYL